LLALGITSNNTGTNAYQEEMAARFKGQNKGGVENKIAGYNQRGQTGANTGAQPGSERNKAAPGAEARVDACGGLGGTTSTTPPDTGARVDDDRGYVEETSTTTPDTDARVYDNGGLGGTTSTTPPDTDTRVYDDGGYVEETSTTTPRELFRVEEGAGFDGSASTQLAADAATAGTQEDRTPFLDNAERQKRGNYSYVPDEENPGALKSTAE
jgi:hypothetical protein